MECCNNYTPESIPEGVVRMSKIAEEIRKLHHSFCTVVVAAAGASERMGEDKLFLDLDGQTVLAATLSALNRSEAVDEIIVVTRPERAEDVGALRTQAGLHKISKVVFGGPTRTHSALAGVTAASRRARIICIHDGARPLVTDQLISQAVHCAVLYEAAAPALPVKDTVKTAENGVVTGTPERSKLYTVQTPQAFRASIIKAALTRAVKDGISYTDDCAAVEAMGCPVHLSPGDEENIKITTPPDLSLARMILQRRREEGTA